MKLFKRFGIIIVIIALCVLWAVRYINLNAKYINRHIETIEFKIGEVVTFDEDYIAWGMNANGYSLRVDDFRIIEYDESILLLPSTNIDVAYNDYMPTPERVGLVTITLLNDYSDAEGIWLPELILHGIDMYSDLNLELLSVLNPILNDSLGVTLFPNTEHSFILPYNLRKMHYNSHTWSNMDDREFLLQITRFPKTKEIVVQ